MHIQHRALIQIPADPRLLREDASEKTVLATVPVETPLHTKAREALEAVGEVGLFAREVKNDTRRERQVDYGLHIILFVYIKRVFFLFLFSCLSFYTSFENTHL